MRLRNYLLLTLVLFGLCLKAPAAIPNYTAVWEVRNNGDDANGGGFVAGASGTDMSQFDNKNATSCTSCQSSTANLSTIDGVCAGNTTLTSATANFTSALVGNIIVLAGNFWVEVTTFSNSTTVTIDRTCGSGTYTMAIGGALKTPAILATVMCLSSGASAWIKADGTYSISSQIAVLNCGSGGQAGITSINGYSSVRGDDGHPTLQAQSGLSGSDLYVVLFVNGPYAVTFQHFNIDVNSQSSTGAIRFDGPYDTARDIIATHCTDACYKIDSGGSLCDQCVANLYGVGTGGGGAFFNSGNVDWTCLNCVATNTSKNSSKACECDAGIFVNFVAANMTGTANSVFHFTTQEGSQFIILGATASNITGNFLDYGENVSIDMRPLLIRNVIASVTGYCFSQNGNLPLPSYIISDHNACSTDAGGTFNNGWPAGEGDVTNMVANPFTNAGAGNYTLNSNTQGGVLAKGTGYPGQLPNSSGTGHIDIGALQHLDAGGSAGSVGFPFQQ